MVIANFTNLLITLVYTQINTDIKEAVFLPDSRVFENIPEYLKIGIPSAFMFLLDVWAGSTIRFFTGYMSVDIQSAQIILNNLMVLLYMVGSGLDTAACALIGQALGADSVASAKSFYSTFKTIAASLIGVVMIL